MLLAVGREAIDELYAAQVQLVAGGAGSDPEAVREALALPVRVYRSHGPLLRAVSEAIASGQLVAIDGEAIRRRFDDLVATALRDAGARVADPEETARALNLLNESYLLDAYGREPRVSAETLTEIWSPLLAAAAEGSS
jgi:hypothetical protein